MQEAGQTWRRLCALGLGEADADVWSLLQAQRRQNSETINLVASESYSPRAALQAEASAWVDKNASGYPPRVAFGGSEPMDAVERLAIARACALFGAEYANVQALSSTIANVAVLRALLRPGDTILAFDQHSGGHGSHGGARHMSGQDYTVHTFGVDPESERVDVSAVRRQALAVRPRMLIAGSSAYPRALDFEALADIAREVGALMFADIAHVAGFVVAGLMPNPVRCCDVVTTSTHKTLCGPRTGGLVLARRALGGPIDAALSPGLQAAPGGHIIAARAVLFGLVARPSHAELMCSVLALGQALAASLAQRGVRLYTGGTDTHMVVIDLRGSAWSSERVLNETLLAHNLVANTTSLPPRADGGTGFGLRVGTTPMAIRGMDAVGMDAVADVLASLLARGPCGQVDSAGARRVRELAVVHPVPEQGATHLG